MSHVGERLARTPRISLPSFDTATGAEESRF